MAKVVGVADNPDNCGNTYYYALNTAQDNYEVLHSTLFAAFIAKKEVRFWVGGCGGQNGAYPAVVSVFVR